MPYQPGPFDSAHIYMQWGGKLPGGEQWSNGLRFYGPSASADADAAAMLANCAAAVSAFHTRAASKISTGAKLSFVKMNGIDVNGHYISDGTNEALFADIVGGAGAASVANQIALAVTLTTGYSRGPAHKGRIYLPVPAAFVDATGLVPAADAIAVSGSVDTFIAALNAVNAAWKVGIFSRKLGAPGHRQVTGNLVGRVLDTQRRRRRSLIEDYQ
jgi:hypothetical protein